MVADTDGKGMSKKESLSIIYRILSKVSILFHETLSFDRRAD